MDRTRIVPTDLNLMEALCVNEVVRRIKEEILAGRYPGLVIDQAIGEVMEVAVAPKFGKT